MFSDKEAAYIRGQRLGRIATVSRAKQSDVAPVGFAFDGESFTITGFDITRTFKYKNVLAWNVKVAFVIDDLASVTPWNPRGVKVHGSARIEEANGRAVLVMTPDRHWSWGLEVQAFENGKPVSRKVRHEH